MNYGWINPNGHRTCTGGGVTIYEYERGLLYRNGAFQRVLNAGRYRVWPWSGSRIDIFDTRRQMTQVANQKLLTSDQVTVTLNITADYEIVDVVLATHRVANPQLQLYNDLQLVARNVVGAVDVDALLQNRVAINTQLQEAVVLLTVDYGVSVSNVGIKDVILAPRIRDLLIKEVEAKRAAAAMLIGAREEVATLRALANAAQIIEKNPALLRLRELDVARTFADNSGNTIVMGLGKKLSVASTRKAAPNDSIVE
ncbi:slipin family protein [bacterium]|nr:MAG: slipin family protein [bacterium]